jgi:hypothetical protein
VAPKVTPIDLFGVNAQKTYPAALQFYCKAVIFPHLLNLICDQWADERVHSEPL